MLIKQSDMKPVTVVVGLDTPMMYKWDACDVPFGIKLAFSKAM